MNDASTFENANMLGNSFVGLARNVRHLAANIGAQSDGRKTIEHGKASALLEHVTGELRQALMQVHVYKALEKTRDLIESLDDRNTAELLAEFERLLSAARWDTLMYGCRRSDAATLVNIGRKGRSRTSGKAQPRQSQAA